MTSKAELLKLAEDLEALADNAMYGKSITELYSELRKEAEQNVNLDEINAIIESVLSQAVD